MKYWFSIQLASLTFFLLCCSTSVSRDPLLEEAFNHHQEASIVHDTVLSRLSSIDQRISEMNTNDSSVIEYQKILTAIEKDFELWDESFLPVPGYDSEEAHDHHHGHEHDHSHDHHENDLEGLSAEKVLELQKDLKLEITKIRDRLDALMAKMN